MNKIVKRSTALLLALALLVGALPALAVDASPLPTLMQATASVAIYKEVSLQSAKLYTLEKNDAVAAFASADGFTEVQAGDVAGYVQTNKLAKLNSTANLLGLCMTTAKTSLFASPDATAKPIATLPASTQAALLARLGEWLAVQYNGSTGYVKTASSKALDTSAPVLGYSQAKAKAVIMAGPTAKDKKLATLKVVTLLPKLGTLGKRSVVLYHGSLGYVDLAGLNDITDATQPTDYVQAMGEVTVMDAFGVKPKALGTLAAGEIHGAFGTVGTKMLIRYGNALGLIDTSFVIAIKPESIPITRGTALLATPIFNGPGNKFATLGQFANGAPVIIIGQTGSFTIVLYNGKPGYAATKSLASTAVPDLFPSGTKPAGVEYYVKCIANATLYEKPNDQSKRIGSANIGTLLRYAALSGPDWVCVYYNSQMCYIKRPLVVANTLDTNENFVAKFGEGEAALMLIEANNRTRSTRSLSALKVDETLMRAAQIRVDELVDDFSYTRPGGSSLSLLHRDLKAQIIGKGKRLNTLEAVIEAFSYERDSYGVPILYLALNNSSYTKTGAACLQVDGVYYWVQLFA